MKQLFYAGISIVVMAMMVSCSTPSQKAKQLILQDVASINHYHLVEFGQLTPLFSKPSESKIYQSIQAQLTQKKIETEAHLNKLHYYAPIPFAKRNYAFYKMQLKLDSVRLDALNTELKKICSEYKPEITGFSMLHRFEMADSTGKIATHVVTYYFDKSVQKIQRKE